MEPAPESKVPELKPKTPEPHEPETRAPPPQSRSQPAEMPNFPHVIPLENLNTEYMSQLTHDMQAWLDAQLQ